MHQAQSRMAINSFDAKCPYGIIFGRDFLHALKIDPCFSTLTINWDTLSVPFKPRTFWHNLYNVQVALVHTQIQESKYEQVPVRKVASQQKHLTIEQREDLV